MRKNLFFIIIGIALVVLVIVLVRQNKEENIPEENAYANWNAYESEDFSLYYPKDFMLVSNYRYEALGPGKEIPGVAFTVPAVLSDKTNLSNDTKLSIEEIPDKESCTPVDFLTAPSGERTVTEQGITITVAEESGAAVGNRYDETVYVYPGCRAVRYFIHSTNIQNYDPGTVQEFDRAAVITAFDLIRKSVIWQ